MKKAELQQIVDKYNFDLLRDNEITREVVGFWLVSQGLIPELDDLVDSQDGNYLGPWGVYFVRFYCGLDYYRYVIYPPNSWLDLWGLR